MNVSCRDHTTKPVANNSEYKELLKALGEHLRSLEEDDETESQGSDVQHAGPPGESDEMDDQANPFSYGPSTLEERNTSPTLVEQEENGDPDPNWLPIFAFDSTPHKELLEDLRQAAVAELAYTNRKVTEENANLRRQNQEYKEEREEKSKKSKFKTNRDAVKKEGDSSGAKPPTPGGSTPEHRPKPGHVQVVLP